MDSFLTASMEGNPVVASTAVMRRHHYIIFQHARASPVRAFPVEQVEK
jgi:hypothetical protein